jgi:hypothetical protein
MMLLKYSLLWLFVGWNAFADSWPSDFRYEPRLQSSLPVQDILHVLNQTMSRTELIPLISDPTSEVVPDGLDQVYANSGFSKTVFVKMGLQLDNAKYENQLLAHPKGFLFQFLIQKKWSVAVFFHGLDAATTKDMIGELQRSFMTFKISGRNKTAVLQNLLLPPARAEACLHRPALNTVYQGMASALNDQGATQREGSCITEAWDSMKNSTLRKIAGIPEFFEELSTDPRKAWSSVVERFQNLVKLATHIKSEISKAIDASAQLSGVMTSDLVCTFIGEMAPDVVLMIAGGLGSAKLLLTIANYAKRLASVQKFLAYLSKTARLRDNRSLTQSFLKKLIRGELSPEQMKTLEKFSDAGHSNLAMGAAQCAR